MLRRAQRLSPGPGGVGPRRLAIGPLVAAIGLAALAAAPIVGAAATRHTAKVRPLVVRTAVETVRGHRETVLTTAAYRTLYYFTADTATKAACTGACAKLWPPERGTVQEPVAHPAGVHGRFTFLVDPNGRQLEYNGHLLYAYSGDTGARQDHGEGKFGKWFVATPTLKATAAKTKTTGGGGYGY